SRLDFGKGAVGSAGNGVAGKKILGKRHGAFQLRRSPSRPKDGQACSLEAIYHARDQGGLGAYNGQVNVSIAGELYQALQVIDLTRDIGESPLMRGTGIAGRDKYLLNAGRLGDLPGQGMFAATAANGQNLHPLVFPVLAAE